MKHLLTLLLIVFLLAGCSSAAGYGVNRIGTRIKQHCSTLPLSIETTPIRFFPVGNGGSYTEASLFEQEAQLIHTW